MKDFLKSNIEIFTMSQTLNRYVLIQDPHHPYAARFMELLWRKYGLRAICFYTNTPERIRHRSEFPILRSEAVAAAYDVRIDRLAVFAAHIKATYAVDAVIPFSEQVFSNAVDLARRLELAWAQPEVMRRFRDKFGLKDYLRRHHPDLRMNLSHRVRTVAEVKNVFATTSIKKFILKPNSGYGNRNIGVFEFDADDHVLESYFRLQNGSPTVMEEFVDGTEYFVNGQTDATGNVIIVAIFEYQRVTANQRHNIDYETRRVASVDPRFAVLSRYAIDVIKATGLRRSPFHMEIKIDDRGPCLIEVGARLAGHGNADVCGKMHDNLDLFDLAAHYYLSDDAYGLSNLNWLRYDATDIRYIHGIAAKRERIYSLQGLREVEAMPEFLQWDIRPQIGSMVQTTVDSLTMPWSVVVQAPGADAASTACNKVRALLSWNNHVSLSRKTIVNLQSISQRYSKAVRVRTLGMLATTNEPYNLVSVNFSLTELLSQFAQKVRSLFDNIVYKLQLRGWRLPFAVTSEVTHQDPQRASLIVAWAEDYLAQPHPMLNRKGAVCPFVQHTIDRGGFDVSFHDEIDGSSVSKMRRVILDEAMRFQKKFPRDVRKGMFSSVVIVFPNVKASKGILMERMHDELKTHFMKSDLMCSPSHEHCTKPSVANPEFEVFRSPFAGFVVRHMDVRDIAFLSHNRDAFMRYRQRYAELFARGEVGNEYGYVDLYNQACVRFPLLHSN